MPRRGSGSGRICDKSAGTSRVDARRNRDLRVRFSRFLSVAHAITMMLFEIPYGFARDALELDYGNRSYAHSELRE